MAADFVYVKSLVGSSPEIAYAVADAILEKGDICHFDGDNELSKLADGGFERDLVIVMDDAIADETDIPYIWLDSWIVIEGLVKGTQGDVGDLYHIDVSSNVQKFEAATIVAGKAFINRKNVSATLNQMTRFFAGEAT